jgi:hypothetical protein
LNPISRISEFLANQKVFYVFVGSSTPILSDDNLIFPLIMPQWFLVFILPDTTGDECTGHDTIRSHCDQRINKSFSRASGTFRDFEIAGNYSSMMM